MALEERILKLLEGGRALDDDEIASLLHANRVYVNQVARGMHERGLITRSKGPAGKLVSRLGTETSEPPREVSRNALTRSKGRKRRREEIMARMRRNVDRLIDRFSVYADRSAAEIVFGGPSVYFHRKALDRLAGFVHPN